MKKKKESDDSLATLILICIPFFLAFVFWLGRATGHVPEVPWRWVDNNHQFRLIYDGRELFVASSTAPIKITYPSDFPPGTIIMGGMPAEII